MTGQRIVVLGGGFGGAAAARTARKLLGPGHAVTLVDRRKRTYLCGSLPWLVVGEREPLKVSRSLGALAQRGIEYVQAEAEGIDLSGRRVKTSRGVLPFDRLVVATGAEYDWGAVPGSAEAHSFYSIETARRLRDAFRRFKRGRIAIAVGGLPYKCPPAPFEMAFLLESSLVGRGIRGSAEIDVFTPEPTPLGVAGPDAPTSLRALLEKRGIGLHAGEAVEAVEGGSGEMRFKSGRKERYDLVVTVPVHRSAPQVREAGLVNESGWIPVNAETLETKHAGVYAIGDATAIPMANGRPMPKAGVFASTAGEVAARNIAAGIVGGETAGFTGEGYCFIGYSSDKAAMVKGTFLAEGKPDVAYLPPSVRWHRGK
ncbi:MAG: NAD(P)/FAD-dependent oxidoreductase, partial [SAR202 cluster bacterium]|nr:NAD(P)/FAD-dependent oxidoreductase [SAR202 cluster bacterium]